MNIYNTMEHEKVGFLAVCGGAVYRTGREPRNPCGVQATVVDNIARLTETGLMKR